MRVNHSLIIFIGCCLSVAAFADTTTNYSVTSTEPNSPPESTLKPSTPSDTVTPPDATTESVTKTVVSTTTVSSQDERIVSSVYSNFAQEPALIGTALTVSSEGGIVTITGSVTAQSQAEAAIQGARSIAGVKDVRSNITVTTNRTNTQFPKTPNY